LRKKPPLKRPVRKRHLAARSGNKKKTPPRQKGRFLYNKTYRSYKSYPICMETRIKATEVELTDELRNLIDKKIISVIKKFFKESNPETESLLIDIELGRTTKHHLEGKIWKCEVNVVLPKAGLPLRIEAVTERMENSINKAKKELERNLRKLKTKKIFRVRKAARFLKNRLLKRF